MYLHILNKEQKRVFLGLVKSLLIADDAIDENEDRILQQMCREMDCTLEEDLPVDYSKLGEQFSSQSSRKVVIIELIHAAYSNFEYHNEEKKFIHEVAKALSIETSLVQEIEIIFRQYLFVLGKLRDIINIKN